MNESTIKAIQGIIGVEQDGKWGPKSQAALDAVIHPNSPVEWTDATHKVKASSFADPADIRAFRHCKEQGKTDDQCFKVGDNGIGCWGDDVSEGHGPACALPPDDMIQKWGSIAAAKHKLVEVTVFPPMGIKPEGKYGTITCVLRDRMPWKKNIKNGAGIDLNPDAVRALGLEPPIMVSATWRWV